MRPQSDIALLHDEWLLDRGGIVFAHRVEFVGAAANS
jgi:hypothetical protein